MQDLINEGIARLAGSSSQAVFHLKQARGGGKTRVLVAFGLLHRLPEWCVYIETPGRIWEGRMLHGFWAHLEWEDGAAPTPVRSVS